LIFSQRWFRSVCLHPSELWPVTSTHEKCSIHSIRGRLLTSIRPRVVVTAMKGSTAASEQAGVTGSSSNLLLGVQRRAATLLAVQVRALTVCCQARVGTTFPRSLRMQCACLAAGHAEGTMCPYRRRRNISGIQSSCLPQRNTARGRAAEGNHAASGLSRWRSQGASGAEARRRGHHKALHL